MAQTILEIQEEIIAAKDAEPVLSVLNSTSKVSIWRLFTYVFASASWTAQKRQDLHKAEVQTIINEQSAHKTTWYRDIVLAYQHGHALIPDTDQYDNSALTEEEIEAAKVVKFASADEIYDDEENLKGVRIKVATLVGDDLAPLPAAQLAGLMEYLKRVKDAGVKIYGSTGDPDSLKLELTIEYDPLVLAADGKRLDGTNDTPVQDAINNFLLNTMKFNGLYIPAKMIDDVQAIDGVVIPHIESVEARYGELDYEPIPIKYQPDSGYLRIITPLTDLIINWVPHHA